MEREELDRLKKTGLYRTLNTVESGQGARVTLEGRSFLQMSGNNYLDLAAHPEVRQAAIDCISRFGVGTGASRLISGNMRIHELLEQRLARFKGTQSALLFSTGYMANLAALTCLSPENGLVIMDRLCHASLIDGVRLSGRRFRTFGHNDPEKLESLLRDKPQDQPAMVVTEGVFSMEGDLCPLPSLAAVARRYGARILLDDAHGTGVMGKSGRGTVEHFGMEPSADDLIQMGTLGKALGGFGAFIAGSRDMIEFLTNKARTFIYTTALPPSICAAAIAALDVIEKEPELRSRLWSNREYLFGGLRSMGFDTLASESPILPAAFPDLETGSAVSALLREHGILAPVIRPPTVPRGTSRLRLTVMASHDRQDLKLVLSTLGRAAESIRSKQVHGRTGINFPDGNSHPVRHPA
jgi:8-amino-7-oxononanoate synthase